MADTLAQLIGDCDTRLAALAADATQAAENGAPRTARAIHATSRPHTRGSYHSIGTAKR
jgi:hypothetical protein